MGGRSLNRVRPNQLGLFGRGESVETVNPRRYLSCGSPSAL